MSQFDNVSVVKKANVYFDGKCVSHTVVLSDGTKKTVGVILPSSLLFNTGAPEIMEGVGGSCRVRLKGESDWVTYGRGSPSMSPAIRRSISPATSLTTTSVISPDHSRLLRQPRWPQHRQHTFQEFPCPVLISPPKPTWSP